MESAENDEEAECAVSPPAGGVAAARGGSTLSCFTIQDFEGNISPSAEIWRGALGETTPMS